MRPYLSLFRASAVNLLQYRSAAIAGVATQFCFGFMRLEVLTTFVAGKASPLTASQTADYVWLGQAFLWLLTVRPDPEIPDLVRSGRLGCELLRPVDMYFFWLARSLARRIVPTAIRAIPLITVCMLCGWLQPPVSWLAGLAFALSLLSAALLGATLAQLVAQTSLWTVAADGLGLVLPTLTWFASGLIIPIPFMPDWLRPICEALPFSGILDKPARIWMGAVPPGEVIGLIAQQMAWCLALIVIGRMVCRRGLARVEVAGG